MGHKMDDLKRLLVSAISLAVISVAGGIPSPQAADVDTLKQNAWSWLDSQTQVLETANLNIWSYAETSLEETKSSKELQALLVDNGFSVESGVAGMETAFVATYGSGKPVIGILAEFDALPGVSQAASPSPSVGPNPAAGHAVSAGAGGAGR